MRYITLRIDRKNDQPREFNSLANLVASAKISFCEPVIIGGACLDSSVTASVIDGHVELRLRDRKTIAQLFGLRPPTASVWHRRPELDLEAASPTDIKIEYIVPQIPSPTDALLRQAAAIKRQEQVKHNTISRRIRSLSANDNALWLPMGDSIDLHVAEIHCRYDVCYDRDRFVTDSGWTIDDTTIVSLQEIPLDNMSISRQISRPMRVRARRPGQTTIRVTGLHSPADTMPQRNKVEHTLQRTITVIPRVARVEISPRPEIAYVNEPVAVRARVLDPDGHVIERVPVTLMAQTTYRSMTTNTGVPTNIIFDSPGQRLLIATFRGHADTVMVTVLQRRAPGH
jgi:hypothetical protein